MATKAQIRCRNWHRQVATELGYGRSTVKHRSLAGSLSAPSPTGVRVYTPPGATMFDEATTDTLVWALWQAKIPRTNAQDDIGPGKTIYENWVGQFPYVDDNGIPVIFADEDWLVDNNGARYKIQNPTIDASLSFYYFEMERVR